MSGDRRLAMVAISGLLVVAAFAFAILAGGGGSAPSDPHASSDTSGGFDGAALPPGIRAPDFRLSDQRGDAVTLSELRGQTVVLAFPYSTCGPSCVVLAEQIRGALDELSRPVSVVMVSTDPAADTSRNIRRFLASVSLSGRVHYLTGTPARLRAVWREYRVTPAAAGRAAFERAASVLLIDADGDERVLFGEEQLTPETLAHDIERLQSG